MWKYSTIITTPKLGDHVMFTEWNGSIHVSLQGYIDNIFTDRSPRKFFYNVVTNDGHLHGVSRSRIARII